MTLLDEGSKEILHITFDVRLVPRPEVILAESYGFNSMELGSLAKMITSRRAEIDEAWDEYSAA